MTARHRHACDAAHPLEDDEAREADIARCGHDLPTPDEIWQQAAKLRETWSETDYRSHGSKPPQAWEPPRVALEQPKHGKQTSSFVERVVDDMG